jgi:hypothetical protein
MSTWEVKRMPQPKNANERGQAVLEMLLVILVLVPLLFGGIELARGVAVRHALDSGTGVAVRALSLDPEQWDWSSQIVAQAVQENVMGDGGVGDPLLRAYDSSGSLLTPEVLADLPFGTSFRLEAEVAFIPDLVLIPEQPIRVRVSHWGIVERYP